MNKFGQVYVVEGIPSILRGGGSGGGWACDRPIMASWEHPVNRQTDRYD